MGFGPETQSGIRNHCGPSLRDELSEDLIVDTPERPPQALKGVREISVENEKIYQENSKGTETKL